ncbi:MAG: CHC2 zinc finger domain-containing protein [Aliarcobacter sp.]|nr:CHC2 zinc finger domain-containing protein [Aliarcobacter sp.]
MIKTESIERLKQQINIIDVVETFIEVKKSGANFKACCPFHGENTPSFTINPSKQIYTCFGCGVKGDGIKFVMEYERLSYPDAIEKIAVISNFTLEYEDDNYRPKEIAVNKKINKKEEVKYKIFNPSLRRDADLKKGFKNYIEMPLKFKMMLIYTYIYNFSLEQEQFEKIEYFAKREVNLNHSSINKLGFIPVEKFDELTEKLIKWFGLEVLVELGVLNDSEHIKAPLKFKLYYIKKGGVITFPSFHIYKTNLVTSFMFRPTQPEDWMIESHMKEIQMSNNDLHQSVPYGLTYDFIANKNAIKCLVEGGPDTLCNEEIFKNKDFLFIGSPGTNGLKEQHLNLLRGQNLRIMLDPDVAGKIATFGSITLQCDEYKSKRFIRNQEGLELLSIEKKYLDSKNIKYYESKQDGYIQKCLKSGVVPEVCTWDERYGDMNDVRKLALSGKAPFKNMEDFLTNYVSVVKIAFKG